MRLFKQEKKPDTDLFMKMIRENTEIMYKTAWAILKNDADAADAIQETILDCYEKLHTLRNPDYFKTWMVRILINNCYQICGQNKRITVFADYVQEIPVEDHYECEENSGFEELLGIVDEKYRLLLTLYYADELKIAEIAEVLNINVNTVKTRLSRAREQIRRYLNEKNRLSET